MAIFALVVEEGSFAGAARVLERSPSVVSTHLRALEQSFEARLLHRTTRRLALTDAGERYLPHCQAVLGALRRANTLTEVMRSTIEGRLRVTAPSALLGVLIVPVLQVMLENHPGVDIELVDSDAREDLEAGEVDVAIRVGRLTELEHRVRRLGQLRDVRVRQVNSPDRAIVLPWQKEHGQVASAGSLQVSSVVAARALVAQGLGWATLPEPAVREYLAEGRMEVASEGDPVPVYAVHALGTTPPRQVLAFIDVAVATAVCLDAGSLQGSSPLA